MAQTTAPARDPQALTLIASSLKALTGGVAVNDVILQATAAYVAGSDEETGTATLTASGNQESLVQLNLSGGPRQEIRNGPAGAWSGPDGVQHAMALHNCWSDAAWFYPGLSLQALSSDPGLGVAYVGSEAKSGVAVIHLRLFRAVQNPSSGVNPTIQSLSTEDLYLDATSLLPLFLDFNVHPDTEFTRSIPVEIVFSSYQTMSGIAVPARIQKFLNGSLLLDLAVGSAAVNSGPPASEFAVTATIGGAQ
jgi:hypothetical protein